MTFDRERGRQAEPVWRSNWSAASSRKNSMLFLRSINVTPSAVRRSSSTDRISEPSCSFWLRSCACSLSIEFALDAVDGAVEEIDGRPEQVLEVGLEPRIAQSRDQGVEDVGEGAGDGVAFGKRPRIGLVVEGAVAVELKLVEEVIGWG